MKRTTLLALMFACGAVQAAEWVPIGVTTSGTPEQVADVSSIKVAGNIRRMWVKAAPAPHSIKGTGTDSGKWLAFFPNRYAFNCDDDTNWSAPTGSQSALWEPVPPDTRVHIAMDFTCSWKPK